MKKFGSVCLALLLFSFIAGEAWSFVMSDFLEDTEGALVVYVNDKVNIEDPSEIKFCFLDNSEKYQGFSIDELFEEALPPMTGKMLLLAAIFTIKRNQ